MNNSKRLKSQFYRFFNLTKDHRLVTHINKDTCQLQDSYTVNFNVNNVEFKAWVQLYDENAIYEFFNDNMNILFTPDDEEDHYLKDKWKDNFNRFLEDLFVAGRGYTFLIYLNQEPPDSIVYPVNDLFACEAIFNSQEPPPCWMSSDEIEETQKFYKHINQYTVE